MSQTTFGDLRSAVEDAMTTPQRVDQVVWLIAQAPDEATAEVWGEYAASKLAHREHDRVNLGELTRWALACAAALPALTTAQRMTIEPPSHAARLMAGWAWSVVSRPEQAPFIHLYDPQDNTAAVALYENATWCCRLSGQRAALTALQILLINEEWTGP